MQNKYTERLSIRKEQLLSYFERATQSGQNPQEYPWWELSLRQFCDWVTSWAQLQSVKPQKKPQIYPRTIITLKPGFLRNMGSISRHLYPTLIKSVAQNSRFISLCVNRSLGDSSSSSYFTRYKITLVIYSLHHHASLRVEQCVAWGSH